MNEEEVLKTILNNNSVLTESNLLLSRTIAKLQSKQDKLDTYIKESYEALADKTDRTIQQEFQYQYLKKLLVEK